MGKFTQSVYNVGNTEPAVEIKSLSVTENGTYSETGEAYSPVIVNVPSQDQWKKVESGTVTIESGDTSTSTTELKTTNVKIKVGCIYLVIARTKAPNSNKYYGTDSRVWAYTSSAGGDPSLSGANSLTYYYGNDSLLKTNTTSYGIFTNTTIKSSGNDRFLALQKRYNTTYTPNWAGEYNYDIYECDLSIFDPVT